ncbi:MAG TPA: hypothetical protein DEQ09_00805 [Bacteroidales bacterium]|nr:hypothetical protein [Bacteroidales bacterium]
MSSMEYIPGDKGFRVTVRMYSDDLLIDLLSLYQLPQEYIADNTYKGPDDIFGKYINERIQVKINGVRYNAELIETEKREIETIMRFFIKYEGTVNNINISNTILTLIYMDQVNLFIYKDANNELAFRFTGDHSSENLKLVPTDITVK